MIFDLDLISKTQSISKTIIDKGLSFSCAESCTGGLLSSLFTEITGASEFFDRGFITYSNQAKMDMLNVQFNTLDEFGAVSQEVASEMAIGTIKKSQSDISISITGIAGPSGGSEKKPVGLVYIGSYLNGEIEVKKFNFSGDRSEVRKSTIIAALNILELRLQLV